MKRSATQSADVVGTLVAERQKFEQWIAALEQKKGSTPPKVYERVHADYTSRLASVMEELGARSGELESQRASLMERSTALSAQESSLREERAEAELRNMVGEYSPQHWAEVAKTSDAGIAKVAAERSALEAELSGLTRILDAMSAGGSAQGAGISKPVQSDAPSASKTVEEAKPAAQPSGKSASTQPSVSATPSAPPPSSESNSSTSGSAAAAPSTTRQTPAAGSTTDASAAPRSSTPSRSVAGTPLGFPASAAAPPSTGASADRSAATAPPRSMPATPLAAPTDTASAPGTRPHRPSFDELAFLKSVAPGSARENTPPPSNNSAEGSEPKAPAATDAASQSPSAPLRPTRQVNAADVGAVGIENLSSAKNETPAFLKNVPSQHSKTLKCSECNAMNYATEWYCERCGAELSAL